MGFGLRQKSPKKNHRRKIILFKIIKYSFNALIVKGLLIPLMLVTFSGCAVSKPEKIIVKSPNHQLVIEVFLKKDQHGNTRLFYDVSYIEKSVILPSEMGLQVAHNSYWEENYKITGVSHIQKTSSWKHIYGDESTIKNHYNEVIIHLTKIGFQSRKMNVIVRAYNSGVAFQYVFSESANGRSLFVITADQTQFTMPGVTKA